MSQVFRHFDSWTEACRDAGVCPGQASPDNITGNFSKGKMHALREVERVSKSLGVSTLSKSEYDRQNPEVKSCTVARLWGGWINALEAAGLSCHPNHHGELTLDALAREFLIVVSELKDIPTVIQLTRRSKYCKNTFTRKYGSYTAFKKAAILHLQDRSNVPGELADLLEGHLTLLNANCPALDLPCAPPHLMGRHLGFRAFAFAPTYETEVVSLFGAVAEEIGFEIVAQREAFPDCEARRLTASSRRRYAKCLIEFELRSSDYRKHKHPINGCDLIICWKHDWDDCPIEVLELCSKIRTLTGWK